MTAIVPYQRREVKRGAVNVVQFATEDVAADVRIDRVDRRNRSSWYAVRLASTDSDVTGRLLGVLRGGEIVDLGGLAVASGSIGSARFAVTTPRTTAFESMFLEIRSEHVLLRVEAPKPPPRLGLATLKNGVIFIAFGAAVAVCGELVALALPRAPLLSAPSSAIAGARVRLPYATRGYGTVEYTAATEDGTVVAGGPLDAASGEIGFAVPAGAASHRVFVALSLRGPLGAASRSASFAVVAPEPEASRTGVARVLSFAARRDATIGGETVLASYLVLGDAGTVALLDAAGKVVASAPFTHRGTTRIAVPPAQRLTSLVAQLTVRRGTTDATASVAVAPNAVPYPPGTDKAPGATVAAAEQDVPEAVTPLDSVSGKRGGIIAVQGRAVAGHPLDLRVMPNAAPMHVELQDDAGETLAENAIEPGATRAALPLPAATERTKYFLVLHYSHNGGEETVVRTVIASPAR
ncbi:MAG: hypothetical protein JWO85_3198 [Candidatus Eremiobacteraeota bacterium]|nr:hypothetical protein [Candidatus Eremiobacteraeota bacterium]